MNTETIEMHMCCNSNLHLDCLNNPMVDWMIFAYFTIYRYSNNEKSLASNTAADDVTQTIGKHWDLENGVRCDVNKSNESGNKYTVKILNESRFCFRSFNIAATTQRQ